jgi:transcription antitermination factor NusG
LSASVATTAGNLASALVHSILPAEYYETRWYAAYTNANHEKRVAEQLAQKSIEHFLPLYASPRRWKDRTVNLQLPLFPGYVFLQLALRDRLQVLQIPSVVRIVGFGGMPAALSAEEVESLRRAQARGIHLEPHPFLSAGRRVRITAGPLAGQVGILKRWKGHLRVLLSIELIQRSVLVDIDVSAVEPVAAGKFHNEVVPPRP